MSWWFATTRDSRFSLDFSHDGLLRSKGRQWDSYGLYPFESKFRNANCMGEGLNLILNEGTVSNSRKEPLVDHTCIKNQPRCILCKVCTIQRLRYGAHQPDGPCD